MGFPQLEACSFVNVSAYVNINLFVVSIVFLSLAMLFALTMTAMTVRALLVSRRDQAMRVISPGRTCARPLGWIAWALLTAACCVYYVSLGLYWASLQALDTIVSNNALEYPFFGAAPALFILFNVAPLFTIVGALCGLLGLWKHSLRQRWTFLDGCTVNGRGTACMYLCVCACVKVFARAAFHTVFQWLNL